MGYRSDVRIITSKEGFEKLKEFVENYLQEHHSKDYNLLKECDIKEEGKEQCYFGWNWIKWYEGNYTEIDVIMEGLNYLGENEYSYRYMRIGENYDDYEEQDYDGEKDNKISLEYPNMTREFNDEYILEQIKVTQLEDIKENKESIDI